MPSLYCSYTATIGRFVRTYSDAEPGPKERFGKPRSPLGGVPVSILGSRGPLAQSAEPVCFPVAWQEYQPTGSTVLGRGSLPGTVAAGYNVCMQAAWKVGLLVVVFVGLLLTTYAVLQKSIFAKETDDYFVEFENAGGLQSGARVLLAGVQIGSVTKVELMTVGKARATIAVEKGHQIPAGSRAVLPTSFISIGDRQVEIFPPAGAEQTAMLRPGDTIQGSLTSPLENFLPDSEKTIAELNATLVAFRKLVEDEELKGSITSLMSTTEKTVASYGGLADRMDGLLARNSDNFERMMATTAVSLENLQAVTVEVKRLVESGDLQDRTIALLDNLNEAVESGKRLVNELNALATDPEMRANMTATLENVKTMTDSGTKIAASAESIASNGVVVSEEAVKLSKKANDLALQVEDLIKTFKETLEKFRVGGQGLVGGTELTAEVVRETDPGRFRTDLNVSIPVGQEKLIFGLYDAFESNKLNLQLKRDLSNYLALRYGVYASKPGVGVDYALAPRLNLRSDVFGLNEPQLDLRLGYQFDQGFNAWLGIERIFQRPMAAVGFGIKK